MEIILTSMLIEIIVLSSISLLDFSFALFAIWWNKKFFVKQLHHRGTSLVFLGLQLFFIPFTVIYFTNAYDIAVFLCSIIGIWLISIIMWASLFFYCIYIKGTVLIKKTLFKTISIDLKDERVMIGEASITCGEKEIEFSLRHLEGNVGHFMMECQNIHLAAKSGNK